MVPNVHAFALPRFVGLGFRCFLDNSRENVSEKRLQPFSAYNAASLHESLLKPSEPSTNRIEVRAAVPMLLAVAIALAGVAWIKPTAAIGLA